MSCTNCAINHSGTHGHAFWAKHDAIKIQESLVTAHLSLPITGHVDDSQVYGKFCVLLETLVSSLRLWGGEQ